MNFYNSYVNLKYILVKDNLSEEFKNIINTDAYKTRVEYLKGETIFKQGAFAPYVLYVVEGLAKVFLQTGIDKNINISVVSKGEFLAFSSVFGEPVHTYSAQAITNSKICMIEKESFQRILLNNPEFALNITSQNYRTEKHLLEIIRNLSYKQMRGKLASALIYLCQPDFLQQNIFDFLTRQDIADFAAISTESAIKFLKEFEKEKLLTLDGKKVIIRDFSQLENISKSG